MIKNTWRPGSQYGRVEQNHFRYFKRRPWLSAGPEVVVPLTELAMIKLYTRRYYGQAFVLLLASIGSLFIGYWTLSLAIGPILFLVGVLLLWGTPTTFIRTRSGRKITISGAPWARSQAIAFHGAVNSFFNQLTGITMLSEIGGEPVKDDAEPYRRPSPLPVASPKALVPAIPRRDANMSAAGSDRATT